MHLFSAFWLKIKRVAFEQMRLIGPNDEEVAGLKRVHIVPDDQRALSADDPCHLYLDMTMEVRIEIRELIFLDMEAAPNYLRYRKLNDFHKS